MPPKTPKTTITTASSSSSPVDAFESLWNAYVNTTPSRLKFIDSFLVFLVISGVLQFAYCVLVSSFPFNAFLAGCVMLKSAVLRSTYDHDSGSQAPSDSSFSQLRCALRSTPRTGQNSRRYRRRGASHAPYLCQSTRELIQGLC